MFLKRKKRLFWGVIFIIIAFGIWTVWSEVPVTEKVSLSLFDGKGDAVKVLLITDLHSCRYGNDQERLIKRLEKEEYDFALLGGDIFDDKIGDENAVKLVEYLVTRTPCYYVSGNHEYWSGRVDEMKSRLKNIGVTVLEGDCITSEYRGHVFDICGVDDPTYMDIDEWGAQIKTAYEKTSPVNTKLLLSHRPEKTEIYEKYDFDLILSGHAHAGQIFLPVINKGLYAPDQGFFAKYVNGVYPLSNGSFLEVSRGLARESTPLPRFFNHPEIVIININ